jgi:hypothetical protein
MKVLTCSATRRRLEALHDGELPIGEQVSVNAHLDWCDGCAQILEELRAMRDAIRDSALPNRSVLSDEEEVGLRSAVVGRVKAEETLSLGAVVRSTFQDMHFVYAGISAAAAAMVCLALSAGLMRAGTMPPAVLAALVKGVESPGSNRHPLQMGVRIQMPRALQNPFSMPPIGESGDGVVALAAVVTREGRVASLELLRDQGMPWIAPGNDEATLVNEMLGVASETRFEPASVEGLPVAVNVVWIVARTTVRGTPELPSAANPRRGTAELIGPHPPRPLVT